jgi:hypothetical protein
MHFVALLFFIALYLPFAIVDLAKGKLITNAGKPDAAG